MNTETETTLRRRGLWLEYLTIGWNVVEAIIAIAAGLAASSIALVGFGFDSTIEVVAASVVVWQFRAELRGGVDDERERRALRLIAVTFFILAAYVTIEATRTLITRDVSDTSTVGIVLAAVSLAVMPTLAWFKRQTALRMGSQTLLADSAETFLCAWLSAILLAGLVLNSTLGWWWADPIAAIGIAYLAVREGWEAWQGDHHHD
ncbi:MAG TPA: cation transporter [Acidimicrobiia bacterium]|jgi:divalent metal cation (Fe/Co/Zn/Cd) transporter|nr:putative cation efflux protein [Acidimicrobiia bacterium]HYJ24449.1 cation transporter [Acidimicrobiia bacterium]